MAVERDYVTPTEAARLLAVSRSTVWRWIQSGRLAAQRLGPKTIRIKRRDLEVMARPVHPAPAEDIDKQDIWKDYDPEKVRAALHAARGAFRHLDTEAFIKEMHEAREQDSRGRPAD